jgi:hypothetical protein
MKLLLPKVNNYKCRTRLCLLIKQKRSKKEKGKGKIRKSERNKVREKNSG